MSRPFQTRGQAEKHPADDHSSLFDLISGPSGSGKSSFHGLLLRYYDPDQGVITFDGDGPSSPCPAILSFSLC